MRRFSIKLRINISEIKSIFSSSVEEIDFYKAIFSISFLFKFRRRFVGKVNGNDLELRVIHYNNSFLSSPILRGKIENSIANKSTIHFSYGYSIIYLIAICLISIIFIVLILDLILSGLYLFSALSIFIVLILSLNEVYNFVAKKKELKYFIDRIYDEHRCTSES